MYPAKLPSYPPKKFTIAYFHKLLTELISEHSLSEKNEVDATKVEKHSEMCTKVREMEKKIPLEGSSKETSFSCFCAHPKITFS